MRAACRAGRPSQASWWRPLIRSAIRMDIQRHCQEQRRVPRVQETHPLRQRQTCTICLSLGRMMRDMPISSRNNSTNSGRRSGQFRQGTPMRRGMVSRGRRSGQCGRVLPIKTHHSKSIMLSQHGDSRMIPPRAVAIAPFPQGLNQIGYLGSNGFIANPAGL